MPEPQRIVVYSPNWLGDAVMSLPALGDVRRHYPNATLAVAARTGIDQLFHAVSGIDEVVVLDSARPRSGARAADFARALEPGRFDVAILFPNSYFSAAVAARARIPERWGYRTNWRARLLTRAIARPSRRHQSAYYRHLTSELGVASGPSAPVLTVPTSGRVASEALLEEHGLGPHAPFVAIAPGASNGRAKQWAPSRYAELAGLLAQESSIPVVLVGTTADLDTAAAIEREIARGPQRSTLVNLTGRTTLLSLIGVLARCATLVTNDSGSMHLASALGRRVVAIFGPTDERLTAPVQWAGTDVVHEIVTGHAWCRPCRLKDCPIDHRCMTSIAAVDVLARIADRRPVGSGRVA
jgi:heptosyltransferase-2